VRGGRGGYQNVCGSGVRVERGWGGGGGGGIDRGVGRVRGTGTTGVGGKRGGSRSIRTGTPLLV